jgi:ligand-binding SRPBCC domain-containing protein
VASFGTPLFFAKFLISSTTIHRAVAFCTVTLTIKIMRFHFQTEQRLPYPLELVFAFFADPANLPKLMPLWQCARIEQATFVPPPPPPQPFPGSDRITAGTGTLLKITIRPVPLVPIRASWDARIENFRWLEGFCDVQLSGPFKIWRHCHTVQLHRSGTLLHDEVEYELPLGPLGSLAEKLFIHRQLAATFSYRQRRTLELLAIEASQQSL